MAIVNFQFTGTTRILRQIHQTALYVSQAPFLNRVSQVLGDSIAANYNAQGRPRWKARKRIYFHPILDRTGRKRDTEENSARNGVWRRSGKTWTLDVISPGYGLCHQYGTKFLPVRKSLQLQLDEIERIRAILLDFPQDT